MGGDTLLLSLRQGSCSRFRWHLDEKQLDGVDVVLLSVIEDGVFGLGV